jgi:hypothetical protein
MRNKEQSPVGASRPGNGITSMEILKLIEAQRCERPGCLCQSNGTGKYMLHCPAHADSTPSLAVTEEDSKVLVHCHGGCEQDAVIQALKAKGLWQGGDPSSVAQGAGIEEAPRGVTLKEYAACKHLSVEFLKNLGLTDTKHKGEQAVRIPYRGTDGEEVAVRFRVAMRGRRFEWKSGCHAILYGLDRLEEIRRAGWVLLVEGESDVQTLWHYRMPALGIPGKGTWKREWSEYLREGLTVFVWQEPDADDLTRRVADGLPELRVIAAPNGIKDPSEAHVLGLDVPAWLEKLKASSVPFAATLDTEKAKRSEELRVQAESVLSAEDPLELTAAALKGMGYGGDINPALIVYLAITSRLLELRDDAMPSHTLVKGSTSAGKSYTIKKVIRLFPDEAIHVIDAGSPRVLIYDDADLRHRCVVFWEADSMPQDEDNPAASAIRNLAQDARLHYQYVLRDAETGGFTVGEIDKPGPTMLLTTSTKDLPEQMATRFFTLDMPEDFAQVKAALTAQGQLEEDGAIEPGPELAAFQGYLQTRAPWNVHVPFAGILAEEINKTDAAARVLRDWSRLLAMVKSTAILRHQMRTTDDRGRLVATLADYDTVRGLVLDTFEGSVSAAGKKVRAAVGGVRELIEQDHKKTTVTAADLAAHLKISKPTAGRWAAAAVEEGWLVNDETRAKHPARLRLGEKLPPQGALPTVGDLRELRGDNAVKFPKNSVTETVTDKTPTLPSQSALSNAVTVKTGVSSARLLSTEPVVEEGHAPYIPQNSVTALLSAESPDGIGSERGNGLLSANVTALLRSESPDEIDSERGNGVFDPNVTVQLDAKIIELRARRDVLAGRLNMGSDIMDGMIEKGVDQESTEFNPVFGLWNKLDREYKAICDRIAALELPPLPTDWLNKMPKSLVIPSLSAAPGAFEVSPC